MTNHLDVILKLAYKLVSKHDALGILMAIYYDKLWRQKLSNRTLAKDQAPTYYDSLEKVEAFLENALQV